MIVLSEIIFGGRIAGIAADDNGFAAVSERAGVAYSRVDAPRCPVWVKSGHFRMTPHDVRYPPKADMQGCCDRISRRWLKGL
jgi:hypothetical protein